MENLHGKRILVVDDSATMRMLISVTMRKMAKDIFIAEAVNGLDAYEKFLGQRFDLVLTDINMPEMDGTQLIARIRESSRDIPIIVITTKGEEKDRDIGLSCGANGYITKPVEIHELKETIMRFLAESEEYHVK